MASGGSRRFDRQAAAYARRRDRARPDSAESRLRRDLLAAAHGRVLEAAVGAGANFRWYPPDVDLTCVDWSPKMVAEARQAADSLGLRVAWLVGSIDAMTFERESFDVVVSTLALCAYPDPAATLGRFHRWLRPGGRLLALEHGLSRIAPLNALLYAVDPLQQLLAGCHSARRPLRLIARAGFEIDAVRPRLAGMVVAVSAKKPDRTV